MLAKVLKSTELDEVALIEIPEIGESRYRTGGVNEFVVPDYHDFQFDEILDIVPGSGPSAGEIILDAQNEAAHIVAQAEANREAFEQEANQRAAQEAKAALERAVDERTAEMRDQLALTIDQISGLSNEITAKSEHAIVELALQIARKVVGREVTIDRDIALTLVKVSLSKLHDRSVAEIHLNPEDLAYIEAHRGKLDFRGSLDLIEDRSISPGGCLVHTDTGDIDARIDSQFDELAHGLFT